MLRWLRVKTLHSMIKISSYLFFLTSVFTSVKWCLVYRIVVDIKAGVHRTSDIIFTNKFFNVLYTSFKTIYESTTQMKVTFQT